MPEAAGRQDGLLPLVIVGGFLGAGKSSWLRHQLFQRQFGRVHVLVNEAAEVPVDDLLLGRADRLDVLAGGCACCAGRDGLRAALHRICNAEDGGAGASIDTIVLETSGVADPSAIARVLRDDPVLVRRIAVTRTIILADGREGGDQLAGEALARAQVEAADEIVVTKAGDADAARLSRFAATLRALAPAADLSFAEFGVPLAPAIDPGATPLPLDDLSGASEPIRAHRLDVGSAGGWGALSAWLSALLCARGDAIVRVKGTVQSPAGRLLLQSVRRHVQPPEILPDLNGTQPADFIVLIGRGMDDMRLRTSWDRFVAPDDGDRS